MVEKLTQMYTAYYEKSQKVRREAPLFAGFLGLGSDPRKHPCHEEFYEAVEKEMAEFTASNPNSAEAAKVARFLIEEPTKYREKDAFWFMYVCVGFVRPLVKMMEKEDCKALAETMQALYNKKERMPVQLETMKMLNIAGR